jgi:hypothetical protein
MAREMHRHDDAGRARRPGKLGGKFPLSKAGSADLDKH